MNLEKAVFSNNEIDFVPSEIGKLNKLKVLDLTSNQVKLLPPDLGLIEDIEKVRFLKHWE